MRMILPPGFSLLSQTTSRYARHLPSSLYLSLRLSLPRLKNRTTNFYSNVSFYFLARRSDLSSPLHGRGGWGRPEDDDCWVIVPPVTGPIILSFDQSMLSVLPNFRNIPFQFSCRHYSKEFCFTYKKVIDLPSQPSLDP